MGGVERAIVELAGRRVFVERLRRSAPVRGAILFVNGAVATTAALRWAVEALADYDLLMFDFPHLGVSCAHNPELAGLTRDAETAILTELVARYRPEFLAAQSWGGTSALAVLARAPGSIQKAIVASYSAGLTATMRALTEALIEAIDRYDPAAAARLVVEGLGERLPAVARRLNERYFLQFDRDKAALVGRQLRDIACASFAGEAASWAPIEVPVLFINGGADSFTPPKAAAPLAALCREPSFAVVPEAGHFLAMESPDACDRVAGQICDFFVPQPARSLAVTG